MDFISLELNRPEGPGESPPCPVELIEQLQILIQGIALHAVESGVEALALFQRGTGEIADSLLRERSADDLMVAMGRTLRLTEDYNRHAGVIFKGQVEELRAMLGTMTETVQFNKKRESLGKSNTRREESL